MANETPPSDIHPVLGVFPTGLIAGGLLAVSRAALERSAAVAAGQDLAGVEFRLLAQATRWPELLGEALIAGVVSALVLTYALAGRHLPSIAFGVVVSLVAFTAFMTGYPEALPGFSPASLGAAVGIAAVAFVLARMPLAGPVPLVVAALVGLGLPFAGAEYVKRTQPGMPVRSVLIDLVAATDLLQTISERPDAPIQPGVITPSIDQRTDTGDKPCLIMPPPASQDFIVPGHADGTRLEVAVGADGTLFQHIPGGVDVEYRIFVDDELAWSTRYAHRPVDPTDRTFDTTGLQWRHVEEDGQAGLPLRAGQTVRFETELVGDSAGKDYDGKHLKLGFGGAFIVRNGRIPRTVAKRSAPNIVYIVMDTLRADRVGCYGYGRDTTPNIDRLAARGLRFTDAYATSSWTWPSTASLLTGLPPDAHGVRSSAACTLNQRIDTLAEALQARGYTTAAFVGNPIVEPARYFDQGFESFNVEVPVFRMSDEVVPNALDWLEKHAPLRFFMYLHLVDPHTPHRPSPAQIERLGMVPKPADWPEDGLDRVSYTEPPNPETRAYVNDLYDASVATGDYWVGEIIKKIDRLGLTESTVICFTTDHGEELFDHGTHGHGHDVWEELVRSPLILAGPDISRGIRRGAVSNRYVPTTLARIAGAGLEPFGLSVDLVKDPTPDKALFETTKGVWGTARYQNLYGLRQAGEVVHWRGREVDSDQVPAADMRYYDVLADPEQQKDLIRIMESDARSSVRSLQELVEEARESLPPLVLGVGEQGRGVLGGIGYEDSANRPGADDDSDEDQ